MTVSGTLLTSPCRSFHNLFEREMFRVFFRYVLRNHVTCLSLCKAFFLLVFNFGLIVQNIPLLIRDLRHSCIVLLVCKWDFVQNTKQCYQWIWMTEKLSCFGMKRGNSLYRTWTKLFCSFAFFFFFFFFSGERTSMGLKRSILLQISGLICSFCRNWNAGIWTGH